MYSEKQTRGVYKRVVAAMSGLANIDVQMHANATPAFDPKSKTIFMPTKISWANNEDEAFTLGRGFCLHEGSHVVFLPGQNQIEAAKLWAESKGQDPNDWHEWLNIFADANNEYKITLLFPHLKEHLAAKTNRLFEKFPEARKSGNPKMQIAMRVDEICDNKAEYPDNFPTPLREFVDEVVKEFKDKDMKSAKGHDLMQFVTSINERWGKKKEEMESTSEEISEELRKIMQDLGKAIGEGNQNKIDELKKKMQELQAKRGSKLDAKLPDHIREVRGGSGEHSEKSIEELKELLDKEKDLKTGWGDSTITTTQIKAIRPKESDESQYDKNFAFVEGKLVNRALRKRIMLQDDYEKQHRSGKIDMNEVRKQVSQCGMIFKPNIFERLNDFSRGGEWAISVLIDCSGSMESGVKMAEAKQALATLAYALDGLPNVHYEMRGFTESSGNTIDLVIKKFSERKLNIRYLDYLRADKGNADGINLRAAYHRIKKFRNMRKIIVVISDGQPAYHFEGKDGVSDMIELVRKIQDHHGIKIIGIGIEGAELESLRKMYPTHYKFEKTKDLNKHLTSLILLALGQFGNKRFVKKPWER